MVRSSQCIHYGLKRRGGGGGLLAIHSLSLCNRSTAKTGAEKGGPSTSLDKGVGGRHVPGTPNPNPVRLED